MFTQFTIRAIDMQIISKQTIESLKHWANEISFYLFIYWFIHWFCFSYKIYLSLIYPNLTHYSIRRELITFSLIHENLLFIHSYVDKYFCTFVHLLFWIFVNYFIQIHSSMHYSYFRSFTIYSFMNNWIWLVICRGFSIWYSYLFMQIVTQSIYFVYLVKIYE